MASILLDSSQDALSVEAVPIFRLRGTENIVYRSAIAFKLVKKGEDTSTVTVALRLVEVLRQFSRVQYQLSLNFTVEVTNSGFIDFKLSDDGLATWLEQLPLNTFLSRSFSSTNTQKSHDPAALVPLQYVHGRCCSLLHLGHQQGLILLQEQDLSQPIWQWLEPKPIPWLKIDQRLEKAPSLKGGVISEEEPKFILVHPAEKTLIIQLLKIIEACTPNSAHNWRKLAFDLSGAILNFDQNCLIFSQTAEEVFLSQARLGLLAIAQFLLREILQKPLQLTVFVEL